MTYLIHGGPVGLGGEGIDRLLKGSELPSARQIVRQAAVTNARNASSRPTPDAKDSGASGGVDSQAQTHEGNAEQDARNRFPPDTFAESVQTYDGGGSATPAPEPKGEKVDVKT